MYSVDKCATYINSAIKYPFLLLFFFFFFFFPPIYLSIYLSIDVTMANVVTHTIPPFTRPS